MKARILLDMDGVIVDLMGEALRRGLIDHYPCRWDIENCCTPTSQDAVFTDPGLFRDAPPIAGALDGVRELRAEHDVWFCSTPWHPESAAHKYEWLAAHGLDPRRLILTHDKSLIPAALLVDDRPGPLWGPWGLLTYPQPWNRSTHPSWVDGMAAEAARLAVIAAGLIR